MRTIKPDNIITKIFFQENVKCLKVHIEKAYSIEVRSIIADNHHFENVKHVMKFVMMHIITDVTC